MIDAYKDESTVRKILYGLGFSLLEQDQSSNSFSGGWRMRIALARALYLKPRLLLLDEPSNHLDLNGIMWLTHYLAHEWENTLIVISHNVNFLNKVCTDIIHLEKNTLHYYRGNYDQFKLIYKENRKKEEKEWNKIERRVREMKNKSIPKKEVSAFIKKNEYLKPVKAYRVRIQFQPVPIIENALIKVKGLSFAYGDKIILKSIDLNVSTQSRFALVGKNGVGKSTLMKLLAGRLNVTAGTIERDHRLRMGYYDQHSSKILPEEKSAVEYLLSLNSTLKLQTLRKELGSVGLEGKLHHQKIKHLSGGEKARVVLASLVMMKPHLLILDEPTNHLDIETIEALIDSFNNFNSGVVMVTHNINFIKKSGCDVLEVVEASLNTTTFGVYQKKVLAEIDSLESKLSKLPKKTLFIYTRLSLLNSFVSKYFEKKVFQNLKSV